MSLQWSYLYPLNALQGGGCTASPHTIPLDTTGVEVRYDVRQWEKFGLHAVFSAGANTGVLTAYRSIDGVNVAALETAQTLTAGSDTMLDTVDVSGIGFIIVRVTTAESGDSVSLFAIGKCLQRH